MRIRSDIARALWLGLLPCVVLAVGAAAIDIGSAGSSPPDAMTTGTLLVAASSPLAAMLALGFVAPRFDHVLVATAAMLTAIGTSTLRSLSLLPGSAGEFYQTIGERHALFVGAGFLALVAGAVVSRQLERLRTYPFTTLLVALALTAATVAFGVTVNGARLWLQVGPLQFQPSEVARLGLAAYVAFYLYDRRHLVAAPWRVGPFDLPAAPYLLPLIGAVLAAVAVLLFQNDLGMAALVVLGAFASVASVLRSRTSLAVAGAILVGGAIAAFAAAPRVRDRTAAWLDPWHDPAGKGFQFVQGDYGLSAGGLFGKGGPELTAAIPEVHTDFILVGIATQWGWLGAIAVVVLMSIIVCRCAAAALKAGDGLGSFVALAIGALVGIQALLICGGTLRIIPLTGLTLPLVSSGGTSMIATLFALGIVVGVGASASARSRAGAE